MSKLTDRVAQLAQSFAEQKGLYIWDVKFEKRGADRVLLVVLDGDRTVLIDDCEFVSRGIDPLLDEEDLIQDAYCLEVSSPGLGRRLYTDRHIMLMSGREVTVSLYKALQNTKDFVGVLCPSPVGHVVIKGDDDEKTDFNLKDVSAIKLNDDLDLF